MLPAGTTTASVPLAPPDVTAQEEDEDGYEDMPELVYDSGNDDDDDDGVIVDLLPLAQALPNPSMVVADDEVQQFVYLDFDMTAPAAGVSSVKLGLSATLPSKESSM